MINKRKISKEWYSRRDLAEFYLEFLGNRELMGFTIANKVIRPLILQVEGDLATMAGDLLSIHMSIERYNDDPNLNNIEELQVTGWDLVLDVDCKPLQYGDEKFDAWVIARTIVKTLYDFIKSAFSEKNIYIKYSGNRGFHLVIPFESLPKSVLEYDIIKYREILYRSLIVFFQDLAYDIFTQFLEEHYIPPEFFNPQDYVTIDVQLASPRHMIRAPYSLHDKTLLVSAIISPRKLKTFTPDDADPTCIDELYIPEIKQEQNKKLEELFILGLLYYFHHITAADYAKRIQFLERLLGKKRLGRRRRKLKNINEEELYPPCIKNLLKGLEDGRKRALFVLVNFFRIIGKDESETLKILYEWNKKNSPPLKERMIEYAVEYHYGKAAQGRGYLPYSCKRMQSEFSGMGICQPDEFCSLIKNPIGYYHKKLAKFMNHGEKNKKQKR